MTPVSRNDLVVQIADRNSSRTEADIQSLIAHFLRETDFGLSDQDIKLEAPAPGRRRIDVEIGQTVIEVKKDLSPGRVYDEAVVQVNEYVKSRSDQLGCRYVGILTDGKVWQCFHLLPSGLGQLVSECILEIKNDGAVLNDQLHIWLGSVLATEQQIIPLPEKVEERLGSMSPSQRLDFAYLKDLWEEVGGTQQVALKRSLWSKLLRTALGALFQDDTDLFLNHTYLVLVANIISHEVLELESKSISPFDLMSGQRFSDAGVFGVVEADFFSWILDSSRGEDFIREIVRKVTKFQWSGAEHDVLKHLYESVIDSSTRKQLGEYYTPDWLALAIVNECIDFPLDQKVLDPSCGSGTFLFHAVRSFLASADNAGLGNKESLKKLTETVFGIDLHPVATALARTTYLLAIGSMRLTGDRDNISIPVYLGDSLQWQADGAVLSAANVGLSVEVDDGGGLFQEQLTFPESVLIDPSQFNQLVMDLQGRAVNREKGSAIPNVDALIRNYGLNSSDSATVRQTFTLMCHLHDQNRDHIWGYYIRNLVRPIWFSKPDGKVDVLIGNPPWLSYRFMTKEMQATFKSRSTALKLWLGGKHATQQDLSTFFIVSAVDQFLKVGGKIGFVVPNSVLSREVYEPFRKGRYGRVAVNLTGSWDLDLIRPHIFPVPGGVIFGFKIDPMSDVSASLSNDVVKWSGSIPQKQPLASGEIIKLLGKKKEVTKRVDTSSNQKSVYKERFVQGATIVPSVLHRVEVVQVTGQLGRTTGTRAVKSFRSSQEKEPWKSLPTRQKSIESKFLFSLYTGSSIVPFQVMSSGLAVLPWDGTTLLGASDPLIDQYPLLASWWKEGAAIWLDKSKTEKMDLLNRINYQKTLENQFPLAPLRVVYSTSGIHLAAAIVRDQVGVIESRLYWATCQTESEAHYLLAILNSSLMTELVGPYQSRGNFGARDFHGHVWNIPIPEFDSSNNLHLLLATIGKEGCDLVSGMSLNENSEFKKLRTSVRNLLEESGFYQRCDSLLKELLGID